MITNFSIFPNTYKKEDKQPDFILSAKIGENQFQKIGVAWKKVTGDKKYLSCKLNEGYSITGTPTVTPQPRGYTPDITEVKEGEIF